MNAPWSRAFLDGNERTMEPGDVIAGNETMHRDVLALVRAA